MPNLTKDTMMLADLPKGRDPGEFLNDADLAALYERELASLPAKDPKRPALEAKVASAKFAAVSTATVQAKAMAAAEVAAAERQARAKDEQDLFDKLVQGKTLTAEEYERAKAYRDAHKE